MQVDDSGVPDNTVWTNIVIDDLDLLANVTKRLVAILAISQTAGVAAGVGSGFIIGGAVDELSRGAVIVCTAAHVLHDIEKRLYPHVIRNASNPFAPQRGSALRDAIAKEHIRVALFDEPNPRFCSATGLHILEFADLAYLIVRTDRPPSTIEKPQPVVSIDSQSLDVGDRVLMFGAPSIDINVVSESSIGATFNCKVGWQCRCGSISKIHDTERGFNTPVYETTIPMVGGMSGGPVILVSNDSTFIAIGVSSKDASDSASFDDCTVPGSSFVIPAAWIHAMPAPTMPGQPLTSLNGSNMLTDVAPPFIRSLVLRDPLAAFFSRDLRVPRGK